MITRISIPQTEEGERFTILEWYKKEKEPVAKGEPLLLVDAGKLAMEVESEVSGVLLKVLVQEGEEFGTPCVVGLIGDSIEEVNSPEFLEELEKIAAQK